MPIGPHAKDPELGYGLLAFGSSGAWELTIDESLDEDDKWLAEIEGPNTYLAFSLKDLGVVRDALAYLLTRILKSQNGPLSHSGPQLGLTLGRLGESTISLVWDNEPEFDRCFLIIGPAGDSVVRVSLVDNDIKMLTDAFQEVVDQLPAVPTCQNHLAS